MPLHRCYFLSSQLLLLFAGLGYARDISYLPLGDSITEITCWRAHLWSALQDANYSHVQFVGTRTTDVGCHDGLPCPVPGYDVHSEGHSGIQAVQIADGGLLEGWLDQLGYYEGEENGPDVVTIHLGTNDIANDFGTKDILDALSSIIGTLRNRKSCIKIVVAQIIPLFVRDKDPFVQELNAAIPAWANNLNSTDSPIWNVDMHTGFAAENVFDGAHPNDAGGREMARRWFPAVVRAVDEVAEERRAMRDVEDAKIDL